MTLEQLEFNARVIVLSELVGPRIRVVLRLLFVIPMMVCAIASASAQTKLVKGPYIGSAVCYGCHSALSQQFFKNPHYESIATKKEPLDKTGCEGCHGPGRAHAEALGKKSLIIAFSDLSKKQTLENCLRCHSNNLSKANIQRSVHTAADVVCTDCHSVHKSPEPKYLLAKKQNELCYGCHGSVRAQFSMPFKHRVNEGVMQCSDCHNSHGTFTADWRMGVRPRMVDQKLGNEEPCLRCHMEKRGPFVFEHASIRVEGCESCHSPHGSMNAKLLKRPVVFTMCLECHTGAGTFGRQNNGVPAQSSSHNLLDPRYQKCTTCHVRIHGSNSDPNFLR